MQTLFGVFNSVAHKRLVAVDLPQHGSHQHEVNGVGALRDFFSTSESISGPISWSYYQDGEEPIHSLGTYTFYDAREKHPTRSEWRLYYSGEFMSMARPGDVLVLARRGDEQVSGLIFQKGSAWLRAAIRFFDLDLSQPRFRTLGPEQLRKTEIELGRRHLASELEVELPVESTSEAETLVEDHFGNQFPATRDVSRLAREQSGEYVADPDVVLLEWLAKEEDLFFALERAVVEPRLEQGFISVDEFISFSLSVQNRRKSRMGYSLQNQLCALFDLHKLRYTPQATTELSKHPDFLFPGEAEYHDMAFDADKLTMLGAKSTCKDRWRQVLSEADRIRVKHLLTLDQAISEKQFKEMLASQLALVVPRPLGEVYSGTNVNPMTVSEFIAQVKIR